MLQQELFSNNLHLQWSLLYVLSFRNVFKGFHSESMPQEQTDFGKDWLRAAMQTQKKLHYSKTFVQDLWQTLIFVLSSMTYLLF